MDTDVLIKPERAITDMLCDRCQHEITEGEDFFYDQNREETYCENCMIEKSNSYME